MDRNKERVGWIICSFLFAVLTFLVGLNAGACEARQQAVQSGCAEWKANPQTGSAVIEWCVCP